MGTLYLVRHGQASLGADDYDQLSALGQRQSERLGEYFAQQGLQFEAVLTGGMRRHAQTWAGIEAGMARGAHDGCGAGTPVGNTPLHLHSPQVWPSLNEYDADALLHSLEHGASGSATHPSRPHTPEARRAHFGRLRQALLQWADGRLAVPGMPRYADFVQGVLGALDHVRQQHSGQVLLVSSGGPIAAAVAQLLGCGPAAFVELNLRIRNTAVSELTFTPKYHALLSFNNLAHLDAPAFADWITFA